MDSRIFLNTIFLLTLSAIGIRCSEHELYFLAIGDWGGKGTEPFTKETQIDVAARMRVYCNRKNVSFIISLGDNFYPKGVASAKDSRFQFTFENVYLKGSMKNKPWYVVSGNHDHRQNVKAQIEYTKLSSVWNYPDYFYDFHVNLTKTYRIHFVMIDTVLLCNLMNFRSDQRDSINQTYYKWIKEKLS